MAAALGCIVPCLHPKKPNVEAKPSLCLGGSDLPAPGQPGGRSGPDSPMMAWTRTESCVRRIRVGRLPFLR